MEFRTRPAAIISSSPWGVIRHRAHGSPALDAIAADAMLSGNGWTCPDCGEVVSGRGPSGRSPAENEPGHAEGCQCLAAAVADSLAQDN